MHFGEAIGLLVLGILAAVVLRGYWFHLSLKAEKILLWITAVAVAIRFLFLVTLWATTSPFLNSLLCWAAVAGYLLILVRFSLMRPRWLTSISALILMTPIFGSALLFPLTGIFELKPPDITPIDRNYISERNPWEVKVTGKEGYDYGIFYRPYFLPFMRHLVQRSAFSEEQCQSKSVEIAIDSAKKVVRLRCPGHQGAQGDVNLILPIK